MEQSASSSTSNLSDEELARLLQNKYNSEEKERLQQEQDDKKFASFLHSLSDSDDDNDCSIIEDTASAIAHVEVLQHEKIPCKYGKSCYRKNFAHFEEYDHSDKVIEKNILPNSESSPQSSSKRSRIEQRSNVPSKMPKICSDESDLPFPKRHEKAAPYYFFLNKIHGLPETHSDPLALVFLDLLNMSLGKIIESAQLNYMVDLDFLMENYKKASIHEKPLLIMYGEIAGNKMEYKNVTCSHVRLPFQFGTHHSKIMIFQYEEGLRIVIHTANIIPDDWYEKTQGFWVSPPFPLMEKATLLEGDSDTLFKRDFVEYLMSYKNTHMNRWANIVQKHDFSNCNVVFVGSIPGYHSEPLSLWGHLKLRKMIHQHSKTWKSSGSYPPIAQCSSIGSLGKDAKSWLNGEFGVSLIGGTGTTIPNISVIYPSEKNVQQSHQGYEGGSCLPYHSKTHSRQPWLMKHFHQWKSECRNRTQSMPHIKTYTRLSSDKNNCQYFMLTSANLSKAAWGCLMKKSAQLFIRSYEAGVLFLPKFLEKSLDSIHLVQSAMFGMLSLPYDVPIIPYSSTDIPWFMDTPKKEPDRYHAVYFIKDSS